MIDFILVVLLRVTILAGLLFAVGIFLTKSRPAMRASLALASLGACLVLPLATPILRHTAPAPKPQPVQTEGMVPWPPSQAPSILSVNSEAAVPVESANPPLPLKPMLVGLWVIGLAVLLTRLGVGLLAAHRLARRGRVETISGVTCRISKEALCPMCLAWPLGQIVLPESSLALPAAQLEACLAHESHHASRSDSLKLVVARLTRALFWPAPFVWLLERQLRAALEEAADDAAVSRHPEAAPGYAQLLRDLAVRRNPAEAAALTMVTPLMLKTRIQRILSSTADRRPIRPVSRFLLSTTVLGIGAAAAFGVFLNQQPSVSYDAGKIKNSVKTMTKSGKEIEIFEIQEDVFDSNGITRIAWRPDGTRVESEDKFPLSSGLKAMEGALIIWARTRADGLHEPDGELDRFMEGGVGMGYGGHSQIIDGWYYFCGVNRKPDGFLQSRIGGRLVFEHWKATTILDASSAPLKDRGTQVMAPFIESLTWNRGKVRWPDDEAMDKAYGKDRGQAQIMLIEKVIEGTGLQIVMKESWQPSRAKIEVFDRQGKEIDMDYSPGLAPLKGRQRGFGLSLNVTPDKIGRVVVYEREGETFNAPRISLAPVK
jgi:beta-lactamase regulating signal transducer with metallopeptidase domain